MHEYYREVRKNVRYFLGVDAAGWQHEGGTTLCGRLGQALKSDTYGDFRLGQLTQVNIVVVSR